MHHCDPNFENTPQFKELASSIEDGKRVVLTNDEVIDGGRGFNRQEYVAVYRIENFIIDETGLNFDLVERLAELD